MQSHQSCVPTCIPVLLGVWDRQLERGVCLAGTVCHPGDRARGTASACSCRQGGW